jgi:hypothetical protein
MLKSLMAKTGKTQGIKFNKTPPNKAPNMAKAQVAQGAGTKIGAAILGRAGFKLASVGGGSANTCHWP